MQRAMMMNREIRRVPRGWKHPTTDNYRTGVKFKPMCGYDIYESIMADDPQATDVSKDDFMPEVPANMDYQIMAYETTSEGTPLTGRAFDDTVAGREALISDILHSEQAVVMGQFITRSQWEDILYGNKLLMDIDTNEVV